MKRDIHHLIQRRLPSCLCYRRTAAGSVLAITLAVSLCVLMAGCGLFSDSSPREVRITLDGEVTTPTVLVMSKEFHPKHIPNGSEPAKRDIEIIFADTVTVFPPAQRSYDISDTKRFMVRATRRHPDRDRMKLRVRVDGRVMFEYDASRVEAQDSTIQYVYIYRE